MGLLGKQSYQSLMCLNVALLADAHMLNMRRRSLLVFEWQVCSSSAVMLHVYDYASTIRLLQRASNHTCTDAAQHIKLKLNVNTILPISIGTVT